MERNKNTTVSELRNQYNELDPVSKAIASSCIQLISTFCINLQQMYHSVLQAQKIESQTLTHINSTSLHNSIENDKKNLEN